MSTNPLLSATHFRQSFEKGLVNLLSAPPAAGTFILALANALQHRHVFTDNQQIISKSYKELLNFYQECETKNTRPNDAEDDIDVMQQLFDIGLEQIELTEHRLVGDEQKWQIDFNQLRSFRPARMSQDLPEKINIPFNENGFHFDKAFLDKEIFIEEEILGKQLTLLYNKFPFCDYHGLLVPDRALHKKQFLDQEDLVYAFKLFFTLTENIPDFVLAYNSIGAGASINHQHFQSSLFNNDYTIELPVWQHNGGDVAYPARCQVYCDIDKLWSQINQLQENNLPFNLVFKKDRIYLFQRAIKPEKGIDINIAWYEMAGNFSLSKKQDFENFNEATASDYLTAVSRQ